MEDVHPQFPHDKTARDRLRLFQQEADRISRAFWLDPRTLRHNLIRAQEHAFQDGRVAEAFRRHAT